VLAGAAAGGGLLLAWTLMPRTYGAPLEPGQGETSFDAWLRIGRDGVVTVAVPQLEMGQGVTTILPQIVAMELGADWRQVAVEPAPVSGAYANLPLAARWAPLWRPAGGFLPRLTDDADDLLLRRWAEANRFTATADGTSLPAYEQACREAGASARALLQMAAAERWGVAWEECEAAEGFVTHEQRRARFAELAEEAASFDAPSPPPLRPEPPAVPTGTRTGASALQEEEIVFPRLDLPAKVDGSYLFAGDVRLPDMVFAAIRHGPRPQAELTQYDLEAGSGQRGLLGVVRGKRFLAALGETWWAAEQALERMAPRYAVTGVVESSQIEAALDEGLLRGSAYRVEERGTGDAEVDRFPLVRRYDIAPAVHGTIETASASARLADGRLELWIASQAPQQAREAAAKAIGLSIADVVLYPMPAGGSFDRRLEHDHAIEAALIAREAAESLGRPVQLTWSRWQEQLALHPRMPAAAALGARLAADGLIDAFRARIACPPAAREFGRRLFARRTAWAAIDEVAGEADPLAVEGLLPPYAIPDVAIDHVPVSLSLPSGRMRANAHGLTCFMVESFIDEIAHDRGEEPLSWRIAMLGQDLRLAQCLQRVARLAGWGGGAGGSGEGLACHRMGGVDDGGRIAVVANATRGEGGVRIQRIVASVDIGRVVNRDVALQQVEGGLIFGLGLTLGSATDYIDGLPTNRRLAQLDLPTLADCPEIAIDLISSDAPPVDPGEIGVPAVAPAIANALYAATGLRLRRLPLLSGGL